MDGRLYVPTDTDHWLVFSLWDRQTEADLTGAVTGDFSLQLTRDGVEVTPAGLYVHEIGSGQYHVSNSADSGTPYRSTEEEQVCIRIRYNGSSNTRQFRFWARGLAAELASVIQALLNAAGIGSGSGSGVTDVTTFKEMLASDAANVMLNNAEFAVAVTYYIAGTPNVIYANRDFREEERADSVTTMMILEVDAVDVPDPQHRDKITVTMPNASEEDWFMDRIEFGDGFMWRLACYQEERPKL